MIEVQEKTKKCPSCHQDMMQKIVKAPIYFKKENITFDIDGFECPQCRKILFNFQQENNFRKYYKEYFATKRPDMIETENSGHVCHNCLHRWFAPAHLRFICGCSDSPYYIKKAPLYEDDTCECFESRIPEKRNYIETPRLILRKIYKKDTETIYKTWASDPRVTEYLTWEVHQSIKDTEKFVEKTIQQYKEKKREKNYLIVLKETNTVIGNIRATIGDDNIATLGYVLAYDYWNQGIMTEAAEFVVRCLFDVFRVQMVSACCFSENKASAKVMKKIGMAFEMQTQEEEKGQILYKDWYSISRKEYETIRQIEYEEQRSRDFQWFRQHHKEIFGHYQKPGYVVITDFELRGYYETVREALDDMDKRGYIRGTYIVQYCDGTVDSFTYYINYLRNTQ